MFYANSMKTYAKIKIDLIGIQTPQKIRLGLSAVPEIIVYQQLIHHTMTTLHHLNPRANIFFLNYLFLRLLYDFLIWLFLLSSSPLNSYSSHQWPWLWMHLIFFFLVSFEITTIIWGLFLAFTLPCITHLPTLALYFLYLNSSAFTIMDLQAFKRSSLHPITQPK